MSLAAAKNSLGADKQHGKPDGTQSPHFYDSDNTSIGIHTPAGSTPNRVVSNGTNAAGALDLKGDPNALGSLVKEFEQSKQTFEDEALAIAEVKAGQNPVKDIWTLKKRFETWKKDFKARLREAKAKAHRKANPDAEKHRRKWWGVRSKII